MMTDKYRLYVFNSFRLWILQLLASHGILLGAFW